MKAALTQLTMLSTRRPYRRRASASREAAACAAVFTSLTGSPAVIRQRCCSDQVSFVSSTESRNDTATERRSLGDWKGAWFVQTTP